jgi:hypothetical protein
MTAFSRSVLALAAAASGLACSASLPRVQHLPPAEFRGSLSVSKPEPRSQASSLAHGRHSPAGLVEEGLHARGIRFGTDGSVAALLAFVQGQFERIAPQQARDGDVLFFDTGTGCGGHVGLVETAEASGRIGFREWRGGSSRHSFATPGAPLSRRDGYGKILNTFLRPKRMDDPADTRYFAGDMLCAAFRIDVR